MENKKELSREQHTSLLQTLQSRFEKNKSRHQNIEWSKIQAKLEVNPEKMWSLNEMENTEGEPDLVAYDSTTDQYVFFDCAAESPKGRRGLCYDPQALNSRKKHKPKNSALKMAADMGITLLTEEQYRKLQLLGNFDTKTSSWIQTPDEIRKLGGALFADFRYNSVFVYHNGAESYYAARGFRAALRI